MRLSAWLAQCAPRTASRALAWYVLLTLAFTWPVGAGLARDVPRDLGDPLLNCWIIGWNASHFHDALAGNPAVLASLWHGNIFHPEPYTLGYSELLLAPALQILPLYALTENLVLCYNVLFLSAFFLSGLGTYLLVRAYTRDWRVAFLAGLLFAFTPYRVNQGPHLQVMSSQWMPLALYGFHRFVETGRLRAALGGAVALAAQNLSCGYFMVFFSLFVPPYVLFEIVRQGHARRWRLWAGFTLAAALVAGITLPAMRPYEALRELHGAQRSIEEIQFYSADVLGWVTAEDQLALWGPRLRTLVRPEGQLFPGLLPLMLVVLAIGTGARQTWSAALRAAPDGPQPSRSRVWLVRALLGVMPAAAVIAALVVGGFRHALLAWVPAPWLRFENHLLVLAIGSVVLQLASPRARAFLRIGAASPLSFAVAAAAVAWYLSLGPDPQVGGQSIHGPRLYRLLLDYVPGFDGLRVPARFAMIVVLFLSVAAAFGARRVLARRTPGLAVAMLALMSAVWLAETWSAPVPMNGVLGSTVQGIADPPPRVPTGDSPPPLARYLRGLPADAALVEFPFAAGGWEMRYVYLSTLHWRRIVNGFSGMTPKSYDERAKVLVNPTAEPAAAWRQVLDSGATHIVVHGSAFSSRTPPAPYDWLQRSGARFLARVGDDEIYAVPRPTETPPPGTLHRSSP
jgi:hypothetical protein